MKAKNVSVSFYQQGGELRVWCASFTLKGHIPNMDEAAYKKKCREIEKILASLEFPDA